MTASPAVAIIIPGFREVWGKMAASCAVAMIIPGVFGFLESAGINAPNIPKPGKPPKHQPKPPQTKYYLWKSNVVACAGMICDAVCAA